MKRESAIAMGLVMAVGYVIHIPEITIEERKEITAEAVIPASVTTTTIPDQEELSVPDGFNEPNDIPDQDLSGDEMTPL